MQTIKICLHALLSLLLTGLSASHVLAQNIKAARNGGVLDAQNNAVAKATIAIIDAAREQQRSLISDAAGAFRLAGLEPGSYRIGIKAARFAEYQSVEIGIRRSENRPARTGLADATSGAQRETAAIENLIR